MVFVLLRANPRPLVSSTVGVVLTPIASNDKSTFVLHSFPGHGLFYKISNRSSIMIHSLASYCTSRGSVAAIEISSKN